MGKPRGRANGHAHDDGFQEDQPRDGDDAPTTGHNSGARKEAFKTAFEKMYDLEKQEEKLMEKWIDPIRKKKAKIKSDLKSEHEIEAPVFNARFGVYYFERAAADGQDFITLEVIKEMWDATPVGGGLDMLDVAEKAAAQRAKIADDKNKIKEGTEAAL